jgi:hypothetical protein
MAAGHGNAVEGQDFPSPVMPSPSESAFLRTPSGPSVRETEGMPSLGTAFVIHELYPSSRAAFSPAVSSFKSSSVFFMRLSLTRTPLSVKWYRHRQNIVIKFLLLLPLFYSDISG